MDTARHVVIGGGVMGRAIVEGAIRAGVLEARRVIVAEPEDSRRAALAACGCATVASAGEAIGLARAGADEPTILLAVKPQMFAAVGAEALHALGAGSALVISIMAGVRSAAIAQRLGGRVRVVRGMPNTPARLGQGVTAIARGTGSTEADLAEAQRLFEALGPLVVRIDEEMMDAFTALAGSGPAYAFYLAEAMERAGREMGFDADLTRRVVAQTLRGAAALMGQADPAALREAVTSKGGTTAAAIAELERERVADAWVRAIMAARDRGRALSAM